MDIQPSEISKILKEEIKNYGSDSEITEVGQVLSIGDGIARIYGLDNVQACEMVMFDDGTRGMALNLEDDNVGVVLFGSDANINIMGLAIPPNFFISSIMPIKNVVEITNISVSIWTSFVM